MGSPLSLRGYAEGRLNTPPLLKPSAQVAWTKMDALKAQIAAKRKQPASPLAVGEGGAEEEGPPAKKYIRRGDVLKQQQEDYQREKREREEKKRLKQLEKIKEEEERRKRRDGRAGSSGSVSLHLLSLESHG